MLSGEASGLVSFCLFFTVAHLGQIVTWVLVNARVWITNLASLSRLFALRVEVHFTQHLHIGFAIVT